MKDREKHLNLTQLQDRGWTAALIAAFLGQPDKLMPNRRNGRPGHELKYYRIERVVAAEAKDEFQIALAKKNQVRAKLEKSIEARQAELLARVDQLEIKVQKIAHEELYKLAIEHYNSLNAGKVNGFYATVTSDREFLDRITVNFLRHECSRYELFLAEVSRKIGVEEARIRIKERVLEAIAKAYPELESECDRQAPVP